MRNPAVPARPACLPDAVARPQHGFTLVELLVALSIMALLALMSWRGLDAMVRASELNRDRSDALSALHSGLQQWSADLDGLALQFDTPAQLPAPGKPVTSPVALDWNGQVLRLIRNVPSEPAIGVQVVAWTARRQQDQRYWTRWQSPALRTAAELQQAWQAAAMWAANDAALSTGQQVAITPLDDWQVYYYRGNSWSNALSSPDAAAGLPDGVRLLLKLPATSVLQGRLSSDWIRPGVLGATP
jgi:general secretion pathway protein J